MSGLGIRSQKDFYSGLLFIAFGAAFMWIAQDYGFGTARRMGPGYFPVILSGILMLIGLIVAIRGLAVSEEPMRGFTLRGLVLVIISTSLFAFLVRGGGLAIATLVLVAVSAVASRRFHWKPTAMVAVGLTIFCVIVFIYGLGLPMPARGPWFGG
jgi:lysylphosphatidylglycerol synthetase-like protein (DUF2156 family)